jgi:hypothetical protein
MTTTESPVKKTDPAYLKQFTREELEKSISEQAHFELLEEIILKRIEKTDQPATFPATSTKSPRRVSNQELPIILKESLQDVCEFLETPKVAPPQIRYRTMLDPNPLNRLGKQLFLGALIPGAITSALVYAQSPWWAVLPATVAGASLLGGSAYLLHQANKGGGYSPDTRKILVGRCRTDRLVPIVVHEAVHHVQWQRIRSFPEDMDHRPAREGHAIGTTRHIIRKYEIEQGHNRYSHYEDILDDDVALMAYSWICRETKRVPNPAIERHFSIAHRIALPCPPMPHGTGFAYFSIQERLQGPKIYAQFINGEFEPK